MLWIDTLNEGDSLTEDSHVAFHYTFNHIVYSKFSTLETRAVEVWVHYRWLCYAVIDGESLVFAAVFRVFHF